MQPVEQRQGFTFFSGFLIGLLRRIDMVVAEVMPRRSVARAMIDSATREFMDLKDLNRTMNLPQL